MTKTHLKIPRFRCRTVPLGKRKHHPDFEAFYIDVRRAPAFSVNPRGRLVHRVQFVEAITKPSSHGAFRFINHYHIHHLCQNGFNIDPKLLTEVLVADPPEDRLLCCWCHMKSELMKLPASDALAGRHVHRGMLVPQQVCCQKGKR